MPFPGDIMKKRSLSQEEDDLFYNNHDMPSKRTRYGSNANPILPAQTTDSVNGSLPANDESHKVPALGGELSPAEQMIVMIGALLAEGERGAKSLEILITKMHPDMLADIVITNMKHFSKVSPTLTRLGTSQATPPVGSVSFASQISAPSETANFLQSQVPIGQLPYPSASATSTSLSDATTAASNLLAESRRDTRRVSPPSIILAVGSLLFPVDYPLFISRTLGLVI